MTARGVAAWSTMESLAVPLVGYIDPRSKSA
jgi:hypothetical protein